MKILTASQLSELDQYTCEEQNISSWELMERAAKLAYKEIKAKLNVEQDSIHVFAGPGNNGGDGLAIAYFMAEDGFKVEVSLINYTDSRSGDNHKNLDRLKQQGKCKINPVNTEDEFPELRNDEVVIDAIFGVGLNRAMPDFVQALARHTNAFQSICVALDVPSGMYLYKSPEKGEEVFKADIIFSFQTPKLPFYLPDYAKFVGDVHLINIGLSQERLQAISANYNFVDMKTALKLFQPRQRFSHKGTYGHAVIVGGSKFMLGSVLLASRACMRSGVGKLSVMLPHQAWSNLLQHLPEAMLIENPSTEHVSFQALDFVPDAIGIGVGLGITEEAKQALGKWLTQINSPMVIDADALNLIAKHKKLQSQLPKKSILTPHPGELKRLVGDWADDFEKIEKIKTFSKTWDVIIIAKDAFSLCVYKDVLYVNSSGNAGMATAGSGDVLTGVLTGLLAQGYDALDAAVLGMYVHGLAGDLAQHRVSKESLIASDLIDHLGKSFLRLKDELDSISI